MSARPKVSEIRTATIGCADLEKSLGFWRDVIGFAEVWRCEVSGPGLEAAWGLPAGTRGRAALLRYGGVASGQIRLLELRPQHPVHVRTWDDDPWAVGVGAIDLSVREPEKAFELLRDKGVRSRNEHPHFYVLSGLEQSEAVFLAPDDVNLLLVGARNYAPDMARGELGGAFSPVTVVSQFVADFDRSARFYRDGLGLELAFDVWTDDDSRPVVNELVGIPAHADVRLAALRAHGVPDGKVLLLGTRGVEVRSIVDRMQPDHLGVVMLSHATDDLDGLPALLAEHGGSVVTEPAVIEFGSHAATRSFLARAPQGVLIEFYEEGVSFAR